MVIGSEFGFRVNKIIKGIGIFKKVKYVEENGLNKVDVFFRGDSDRFFLKDKKLKYQREYRIIIDEKVEENKVLEIGDLKDIAHVMKINDFLDYKFSIEVVLKEE